MRYDARDENDVRARCSACRASSASREATLRRGGGRVTSLAKRSISSRSRHQSTTRADWDEWDATPRSSRRHRAPSPRRRLRATSPNRRRRSTARCCLRPPPRGVRRIPRTKPARAGRGRTGTSSAPRALSQARRLKRRFARSKGVRETRKGGGAR